MEHIGGSDTNCTWTFQTSLKENRKKCQVTGYKRINRNHTNHQTVKSSLNSTINPEESMKIVGIQTSIRNPDIKKHKDLARELKNICIMKVIVTSIVVVAHGAVTKDLVKRLGKLESRGRFENIRSSVLFVSARIVRNIFESEKNYCHANFSEKSC